MQDAESKAQKTSDRKTVANRKSPAVAQHPIEEKPKAKGMIADSTSEVSVLLKGTSELAYAVAQSAAYPQSRIFKAETPSVSYSHLIYNPARYRDLNSSRNLICDISEVVEGSMLLSQALDYCQNCVLTMADIETDDDVLLLVDYPGYSGLVQSVNHIQTLIRSLTAGHRCMSLAVSPSCTFEAPRVLPSSSCTLALVVQVQELLCSLKDRIHVLYDLGAISVIKATECIALIELFCKDQIDDELTKDCPWNKAVMHSSFLGIVGAALRVHNVVCSALASDLSFGFTSNVDVDFPIINKDWTNEYDSKQG